MFSFYQDIDAVTVSKQDTEYRQRTIKLSNKEAKLLNVNCVTPKGHTRQFTRTDVSICHVLHDISNNEFSYQDIDWEPAQYFEDNFDTLYEKQEQEKEDHLKSITDDIQRQLQRSNTPSEVDILRKLSQTTVLSKLLTTRNVNQLVGLMLYMIVIHDQDEAVNCLKSVISGLPNPLTAEESSIILATLKND